MTLVIRPVEAHELAALSATASQTYAETFGHTMSAADLEAQLRTKRSEAYFKDVIEKDTVLVAVKEGEIAGYIQLSDLSFAVAGAVAGDQELFALYVRGVDQGKGIGRALMMAAFDQPRFKRAPHVYLDVWAENERALRLYRAWGFSVVGRRDFVVEGRILGRDLVMMRPGAAS